MITAGLLNLAELASAEYLAHKTGVWNSPHIISPALSSLDFFLAEAYK